MSYDLFLYSAEVLRVIDGDTVDVMIDLGFGSYRKMRLRLYGIDAPERRGETREAGNAATDYLRGILSVGATIVVKTFKDKQGKYGRYLALIYTMHDDTLSESINDRLVADGHAVKYGA